ncbi:peptidoglycan-recognition protein LC-like [Leptopilina heterotoma]|uniref:peptidoglycan-recognition protein LC-like n=1 Tax=Leptopilina heterotoma TaxID=63436 RepID=UPI001CA7F574|nr:peptidoglycan-recognition protein LC-like [Leptopilina heterotoma]
MRSDDSSKSFDGMVTLDQQQLQQHRQDQDDNHRISNKNSVDYQNFQNLQKLNGIRKIVEEKEEEDVDKKEEEIGEEKEKKIEIYDQKKNEGENEENVIVNNENNDYYLDIESYDESTSSSDVEEDLEEDVLRDRGWVSEIPSAPQNCEIGTANGIPLPSVEAPCFGDVCVKNSNNVHLGSKTFYKGPVTIKQFVYSNSEYKKDDELEDSEKRDSVRSQNISQTSDVPLNSEFIKVKQWLITWKWAAIFFTIVVMFVTIIVMIVLTSGHNKTPHIPIYPELPDSSTGADVWIHGVKIVSRDEWLAQPPQEREKLSLPVKYVFISHTATDFCNNQAQCVHRVRYIQTFHMSSQGWADIGYSFLIGGDGNVYEGRGWDYVGAHTYNYNNISIGLSFIGTFNDYMPPKSQIFAAQKIIEKGVELGKISKNYTLLGHRQVSKTESPGDALFSEIKKWPQWAPTP